MQHLKTFLAHYMALLAGGAAVVAGYDPGLLSTILPFLGPHAAAIVGGAAGLVAVLHAFGVDPATKTTATTVAKLLLIALVLPLLHACTTLQAWISSPTGQVVVTAGVQVAVTTAEQKGLRAAQINSVAKSVLQADQGATATLAVLTNIINKQLAKLNLPAADIDAFTGLELAFDTYLVTKYGNNATVQNLQADVAGFCNQVIADTGG